MKSEKSCCFCHLIEAFITKSALAFFDEDVRRWLGIIVYGIEGPFFFAAVETFERALINMRTDPKILIIRLLHVPFIDITGLKTIIEVIEKLEKRGVRVMLCEANARVYGKLVRAGVLSLLQPNDYADDFATIVARCTPAGTTDTIPPKAA